MLKFAIPAVAALGLIAAAAQSQATDVPVEGGITSMSWHLSHEGSMAKLAYGLANSDQLALMMTCEPGQPQAIVYGDVQPVGPRLVKASLNATVIDPLSGGLADETRISLRDPEMIRLARIGKMTVQGEAGHFELTADRDEQGLVRDFFAYCGTDKA